MWLISVCGHPNFQPPILVHFYITWPTVGYVKYLFPTSGPTCFSWMLNFWLHFIFQAAAIRLELRGGGWKNAYLQMDGEPWKQPISKDFSTFVEIKREPFQSLVVGGKWFCIWFTVAQLGFIRNVLYVILGIGSLLHGIFDTQNLPFCCFYCENSSLWIGKRVILWWFP